MSENKYQKAIRMITDYRVIEIDKYAIASYNAIHNESREIIDNMFEYIKDEDLELIAKELNINDDDKIKKEDKENVQSNSKKNVGVYKFYQKNDIETIWRIHVDEIFTLASKNSEQVKLDESEDETDALE